MHTPRSEGSQDDQPHVQVKPSNPYFYPLRSRVCILDDFNEYLVEQDIKFLYNNPPTYAISKNNLTISQFTAIKELRNNSHMIVIQADEVQ